MARGRRSLLFRSLILLFALNVAFFVFYIFLHLPIDRRRDSLLLPPRRGPPPVPPSFKPWPLLSSFLPWRPSPSPRSCEAYFGHGFSRRVDVLPAGGSGWFRCFYSETLACSICEGGRIRMDPERIRMSAGGENLEAVMGRNEEEELPVYENGAFQIEGNRERKAVDEGFLDRNMPRGAVEQHPVRALVDSMQVVGGGELQCSQWIDEPTVLVTRFEYANLFHTVTDWYSAYVSSRVTDLSFRPNLVFVDGHCKTPLEETWEAIFSSVRYAKNFTGPVCFRHVILAPLGYETVLFKGLTESIDCQGTLAHSFTKNPDDKKIARLSEFGEMLRASFGLLENGNFQNKTFRGYNVLFVRRENYLAHPRHNGKVESRLSNEQEVFNAVKDWAPGRRKCKINVVNGLFSHMHMKEQIRVIQEASVVIGAHGAGLTHLVAATPGTIVLEIVSRMYNRPHFALISRWKGLEYHAINLDGSYAKPARVLDELSNIMHNLGC